MIAMSYRDELESAQARIRLLEDEIETLKRDAERSRRLDQTTDAETFSPVRSFEVLDPLAG